MKHTLLYSALLLASILLCGSCSDWLDVRGENVKKESDQFDSYKGFRDALTGCYMQMAATDAYGQQLTMTNIEDLADLWYCPSDLESTRPTSFYLHHHNYEKDNARSALKAIYAQLFTTIASANVVIKNVENKGGNIGDSRKRDMILGEAYAIRAFCQLDVLRLFGPCPADSAASSIKLPYSFTTGIKETPAYYSFHDYVALLDKDLNQSLTLLKGSDPIFSKTFATLNSPDNNVDDDYTYYRQARLNYWAVKALQARESLYLGRKQRAHDQALEVINAKGADGNALIKLSGIQDLTQGYNALPSECLFYLSKYDVNTYANKVLAGANTGQARNDIYYITSDMLQSLYSSLPGATASHNRYLNEWFRTRKDPQGKICPTITKYWYDTDQDYSQSVLTTKLQIIPMLRLSEMYLTAMEASESLSEIRQLYDTYMSQCAFTLYKPFTSLTQVHEELTNEWRREFFAEGQMFYVYKRLKTDKLWNGDEMKADNYVIPLPQTEYDPNAVSNN